MSQKNRSHFEKATHALINKAEPQRTRDVMGNWLTFCENLVDQPGIDTGRVLEKQPRDGSRRASVVSSQSSPGRART